MKGAVFPWRDGNRFELLIDGPQFFPRMLAAIADAQEQVELELYLVEAGACAEAMVQTLVEASFTRLGAITAAMHNQASAWQPPPGFKRHALDSDGLMGMTPHWGEFWEHRSLTSGERRLLLDARQRKAQAVFDAAARILDGLPRRTER